MLYETFKQIISNQELTIPNSPGHSKKAADWREYYHGMASWYESMAKIIKQKSPTAAHADEKAAAFREAVRRLDNGTYPAQIQGRWK